jgi:hypothetical protein
MRRHFPREYSAYKNRTKALIPLRFLTPQPSCKRIVPFCGF